MDSYFEEIVSELTYDEMVILGLLSDQNANSVFKSIKKKSVQEQTNLTDANIRKSILRLEAKRFIEINSSSKEYRLYITEYGQLALNKQLQGEEF